MKKALTIFSFIIALLVAEKVHAQLCIKAGYAGEFMTIDTISESHKGTDYYDGFFVGFNWDFELTNDLDLSVGAQYRTQMRTMSEHYYEGEYFIHYVEKRKQTSIDLPILLNYKFDLGNTTSISPFIGPMLSYALTGTTHSEWTIPINLSRTENWYEENGILLRKRFNVYGMMGVNFCFSRINISASYRYGFLNLSKSNNFAIKTSGFSISAGYSF